MTTRLWTPVAAALAICLLTAVDISAQIEVMIHGRVEDSVTRLPVSGARIFPSDSTTAVFTDSLGAFSLPASTRNGEAIDIRAERIGYSSQAFEVGVDDLLSISVLLLEPSPLELEGFEVVEEAAIDVMFRDLARRRNAYPASVRTFDKAALERFHPVGTAWDLVLTRVPGIFECSSPSGLCVPGRNRSFATPSPESPIFVCVDGFSSWGAASELSSLDIRAVALIELYRGGRDGIRVYTAGYLAHAARVGLQVATPTGFGC